MPKEKKKYDRVFDYLSDFYGAGEVGRSRLRKFVNDVAKIESDGGRNDVNPDSSARGVFQFLTKGEGNSWQTGLNRTESTLKRMGSSREWLDKARKHGDPRLEPYERQEDVFLADLFQKGPKGATNKLFRGIIEGDPNAAFELYSKYHHTDPSHAPTQKLAAKVMGTGNYRHGGLIRDAYGRTLI